MANGAIPAPAREKRTKRGWRTTIGLILCTKGNHEEVELLQLDKVNIKEAEYITKNLPKELLIKKLYQFTECTKRLIENRDVETDDGNEWVKLLVRVEWQLNMVSP